MGYGSDGKQGGNGAGSKAGAEAHKEFSKADSPASVKKMASGKTNYKGR